jgi:hypothetical protein
MIYYLQTPAAKLRQLLGDRRAEIELDDEIESHLCLFTQEYVRQW